MKKRLSFWDILAWIVLGLILLWVILKMLGIINTPEWLAYSPIIGVVYLAGWAMHKLDTIAKEVIELKKFKEATITEIHKIRTDCIKKHKK